jgi:hypothetical protein
MIRVSANDDGWSLFRGGLIGERKWDQNDAERLLGETGGSLSETTTAQSTFQKR